jgi:hypothetical protein
MFSIYEMNTALKVKCGQCLSSLVDVTGCCGVSSDFSDIDLPTIKFCNVCVEL